MNIKVKKYIVTIHTGSLVQNADFKYIEKVIGTYNEATAVAVANGQLDNRYSVVGRRSFNPDQMLYHVEAAQRILDEMKDGLLGVIDDS